MAKIACGWQARAGAGLVSRAIKGDFPKNAPSPPGFQGAAGGVAEERIGGKPGFARNSGTSAARRGGSSPLLGTKFFLSGVRRQPPGT